MTITELKQAIKEAGAKAPSRASKAELEAILAGLATEQEQTDGQTESKEQEAPKAGIDKDTDNEPTEQEPSAEAESTNEKPKQEQKKRTVYPSEEWSKATPSNKAGYLFNKEAGEQADGTKAGAVKVYTNAPKYSKEIGAWECKAGTIEIALNCAKADKKQEAGAEIAQAVTIAQLQELSSRLKKINDKKPESKTGADIAEAGALKKSIKELEASARAQGIGYKHNATGTTTTAELKANRATFEAYRALNEILPIETGNIKSGFISYSKKTDIIHDDAWTTGTGTTTEQERENLKTLREAIADLIKPYTKESDNFNGFDLNVSVNRMRGVYKSAYTGKQDKNGDEIFKDLARVICLELAYPIVK